MNDELDRSMKKSAQDISDMLIKCARCGGKLPDGCTCKSDEFTRGHSFKEDRINLSNVQMRMDKSLPRNTIVASSDVFIMLQGLARSVALKYDCGLCDQRSKCFDKTVPASDICKSLIGGDGA